MDKETKRIPKLELAFKNQGFSGIVANDFLIEEGEVVNYIHDFLSKINELKEQVKAWKNGPLRLTSLKYCEKHNALGLPTMMSGNLACCLEQRVKELEGGIERWLCGDWDENDDAIYFKKLIKKEKP